MLLFYKILPCLAVLCASLLMPAVSAAAAEPSVVHPTDVVIDIGHGGIDGGTSHGDLLEKDINLAIGKTLFLALRERGCSVIANRLGDYALSDENGWLRHPSRHKRDLVQRKELANQLAPKVMVSIHTNWSKNPGKSGALVLCQNNSYSLLLAGLIQQSLNGVYGTDERPVPRKRLFLLNRTLCPTVIVETGYVSNEADRARLTSKDGQREIARAIADAIVRYFKMTGTGSPESVPPADPRQDGKAERSASRA